MNCVFAIFLVDLLDGTEADFWWLALGLFMELGHSVLDFLLSVEGKLVLIGLPKTPCQHEQIHVAIDHDSQLDVVQIIPIVVLAILTRAQPLVGTCRADELQYFVAFVSGRLVDLLALLVVAAELLGEN